MASIIRIAITGNARDAVRALNQTRDAAVGANRSLSKLSSTSGIVGLVTKLAATRVVAMGLAIGAAVPYAVTFAHALAPMLGYLVTIPAAVGAATAVMATLRIAFAGVSDALKSGLSGDLKKFQKDMQALQPAQRTFVTSIVALRQPIANLKATVGAAFFAPFAKDVAPLAKVLIPALSKGLGLVGKGLGMMVDRFAKAAAHGPLIKGISATLAATGDTLARMAPLAGRIADTLGRMFTASAPTLKLLSRDLVTLVDKFLIFLNRSANPLKVTKWLDDARQAARDLWAIGKNVLGILGSIFKAGGASSGGLLATIRNLTGRLDTFLKSTKGRNDLARYFKLAFDMGTVVLLVLRTIAPAMRAIVGYAADFARWLDKHKKAATVLVGLFVFAKFAGPLFALIRAFVIVKLVYAILKSSLTIVKARLAASVVDLGVSSKATKQAQQRAAADVISANAARQRAAADVVDAGAVGRAAKVAPIGAAGAAAPAVGAAGGAAAGGVALTAGLALAAVVAWGIAIYQIVHNWSTLKHFLSQDITSLGISLTRMRTAIYNGIGKAALSVAHGFMLLMHWLQALPGRVVGFLQSLPGRFLRLGRDLASGLVHGIYSNLKSGVTGIGTSIVNWLKHSTGVRSPSVLTFAIGKNLGQGLANGLRSSQSLVLAETRNLGGTVAAGINPALRTARVDRPTGSARPVTINVNVPPGGNLAKTGELMKKAIRAHERESGHKLLVSAA